MGPIQSGDVAIVPPTTNVARSAPGKSERSEIWRWSRKRGVQSQKISEPAIQAGSRASQPAALGSGSQCYIDQGRYYNEAFGAFFQRLAADGITPKNTLFVLSSDEGDHEAGANVGRALAPSPAGCDGVTVPCTYTSSNFGEISVNATGLLASETGNTTPFSM